MKWRALVLAAFRLILVALSILLVAWANLRWLAWLGVCGLALSSLGNLGSTFKRSLDSTCCTWTGWLSTAVLGCALLRAGEGVCDAYYALLAWSLGGITSFAAMTNPLEPANRGWRRLSLIWFLAGDGLWLAWAYLQNLFGAFHFGLVLLVATLVFYRISFRPRSIGIQAANTLIAIAIFLPLLDWVGSLRKPPPMTQQAAGTDYSFEAAKGNPHLFMNWWRRVLGQCSQLETDCFEPDPSRVLPYRLRPGSQGRFFESQVEINSLGFRGKELANPKGETYRIIALGESTTFGIGLAGDYRPWPELLEKLIRERLKPKRPVEVVNAGMIRFTLEDNLHRLRSDILPLHPDLLISYHGWNGFHFFAAALPPVFGKHLPIFKHRPSRVLAECEYRLKMSWAKHRMLTTRALNPPPVSDLTNTRYAKAYQELIGLCASNHISLVLGTYSMAVNPQSPPTVVDFYREAFPALYWQIQANQMHSRLLQELAIRHPDVHLADTHPFLDGLHHYFIDPMHFTQEGDRFMAEAMFAGVSNIVRESLSAAPTQPANGQQPATN